MPGIVSYGAYLPPTRLGFSVIGGRPPKEGGPERTVAWNDEDAVTMAVAAGANALRGFDRAGVDALFFASTTYPFKEKQGAALIAKALDLRRDARTTDVVGLAARGHRRAPGRLRRGGRRLGAARARDRERLPARRAWLRAGAGLRRRRGRVPDRRGGRGRAARRRARLRRRDRGRVAQRGRPVRALVGGALRGAGGLHARHHRGGARAAASASRRSPATSRRPRSTRPTRGATRALPRPSRLDRAALVDPLFGKLGNAGVAFAPLLLAAALESAKPGERILLASYGDGAAAFAFAVTPHLEKLEPRRGVAWHLARRRPIASYDRYLKARSLDAKEYGGGRDAGLSATIHSPRARRGRRAQGPALQPLRRAPVPAPARVRALLREGRLRAGAARRAHRARSSRSPSTSSSRRPTRRRS